MDAAYDSMVPVTVTFSDGKRSVDQEIMFVIISDLGARMIIGGPTLKQMDFAVTQDLIELRALDLSFKTVYPIGFAQQLRTFEFYQKQGWTIPYKYLPDEMKAAAEVEGLPEGEAIKGFVQFGGLKSTAVYDTGSYRNAINEEFFYGTLLEAQKRTNESLASETRYCGKIEVEGLTRKMMTYFDKVVDLTITFRGKDGKTTTVVSEFIIMPKLTTPVLLGSPLLDELEFALNADTIELRSVGLEIPYFVPPYKPVPSNACVATAVSYDYYDIQPGETKERWLDTNANPNQS